MGLITNKFVREALAAFFFIAATVSSAQEQSQTFDFKCVAGPAKSVFAELSKAAGTSLVASNSVASDVIVLDLKGVSVNEAMARIAQALHADWRKEGSGWVLYRGSNFEAADARTETAERVAAMREEINKMVADQKGDGKFDEKAAQKIVDAQNGMFKQAETGGGTFQIKGDFNTIARRTPASRAIANLVSRMTDAQLALIASGKRIVFSTSPTRMQYGLPNGNQQIVRSFVQEQLVLNNVTKQSESAQPDNRRMVINGFGGDQMGDGDPSLGVGYAMLVASPGPAGPAANLSLIVSDPNGKTLATGSLYIGGQFKPNVKPITAQPVTGEKPIEFSELSKEFAKLLNPASSVGGVGTTVAVKSFRVASFGGNGITFTTSGDDEKTPAMSDELRKRILHPEQYDPFSFAPSEALLSSADQAGKNLVAYLPDSSLSPLSRGATGGSTTPSMFIASMKNEPDLTVVEDGGWLLVSPKAPTTARSRTTNRNALGPALRTLDKKGYLSLDELALFASVETKEPRYGDIDTLYFKLINTQYAQSTFDQYAFNGGWSMLQFWATLSMGQRMTVLQGGRLPIANLSNQQLAIVAEQVYQSFDGPQVQNPNDTARPGSPRFFGMSNSVLTERTVVLPNGILRDGYLTVTPQTQEGVQAKSSENPGSKFMNVNTLAFYKLSQERADMNIFGNQTNIDQFRPSSQKQYQFEFTFAPNVTLSRSLSDDLPSGLPFGPYDKLPDTFRKSVEDQLNQLRNGFKGFGGPGGGSRTPPPL